MAIHSAAPQTGSKSGDWQWKLTVLFTGLFLLPFVLWFGDEEGGWLPKSVQLVEWTLVLVFLTEALLVHKRPLRRILQFVLILCLNAVVVGYQPIGGSVGSWESFTKLVYDNSVQLFPYFWFCAGFWLLYLGALWWVNAKPRIYIMIGLGIFVMALRDSFSEIILWDKAAILILSGLFLLVIRQFTELKRRNPSGWAYFADYPLSVAAPIVVLLVFTVGLGMLAPNIGNLLEDPYTLYMKWKGETVTARGKGTADSPLLSSNATSGYSRGDSSLGGGFNFDYTPVFTVDTTHSSYWRGETRSFYNGKGWERSGPERQAAVTRNIQPQTELPKDTKLPDGKMKTLEIRQTVVMEDDSSYPVLFGAFNIAKLDVLDEGTQGFERLQWSAKSSELRWMEIKNGNAYPKTYTVVSRMPVIDETGLRTASADYSRTGVDDYLQLPSSVPERVKALAKDITKNASNPYDKAKALEAYLQYNYKYTSQPTDKGNGDFVDRFLFETKEGYCDYFSTSMAVLSRSIGLPARWVKGYREGMSEYDAILEDDFLTQDAKPESGEGLYTVRNADAHSWVEIYFNDWGWIPFEATAGFTAPRVVPSEIDPGLIAPTDPADSAEAAAAAGDSRSAWSVRLLTIVVIASGAALLLAWAVWYAWKRGARLPDWLLPGRKPVNRNEQLVVEYNRLMKKSKRKGFSVYEHETARETITRWTKRDFLLADDLQQLLRLFEKAKYSPVPVSAEEFGLATDLVARIRKKL